VRRGPEITRRLARHRLALATAMLAVVLAATLLAALASFTGIVTGYAVRRTLAGNPGTAVIVTASVSGPAAARAAERGGRAALRRLLPGVPVAVSSILSSDYVGLPARAGRNAETHVTAVDGLQAHAALVRGGWPTAAGRTGPVPAAVTAAEARRLHLAPGAVVRLHATSTGAALPVRITGILRPLDPASRYWQRAGLLSPPRSDGGFEIFSPLLASRASLLSGRIPPATISFAALPEVTAIRTSSLTGLGTALAARVAALAAPGMQNIQVSTGLPGLLTGLGTALVVARSQLAIGVLILLVVAGATLVLSTSLLSSQREGEIAMLASRGASRWQLARSGLAEGVILVVPAAVAGPLLGGSLLPALARRGPLVATGLRLPAAYPPVAWLAAGLAAAACAVVISLPWLRAAPSPVAQRAASGRRRALASAVHAGADLALVVLAALASWQLVHYSAPVSAGLNGAIGVDPVLVSAPVLALAAGAVVMLRALPAVVRLADRAAGRGRAITAAMAAWQISRRPLREAGPVLLMVLAVATTVVAVAQWSSWQRSAGDRAAFSTGADLRVTLPPATSLPMGQVTSLTRARGVTGATPVLRLPLALASQVNGTMLGLDPRAAMPVAAIRPDLAAGSPDALLRRLEDRSGRYGVTLPGRPVRLAITAELTGGQLAQPVLGLQVTDRYGIAYQLTAGQVPADGRPHVLSVPLAPGGHAAYPLRVTGVSLQYLMPARAAVTETLTIASLRTAGSPGGPLGPALPATPLASPAVSVQASAGGTLQNAGGPVRTLPGSIEVRQAPPAGTAMSFGTGSGEESLAFPGAHGRVPATVSFAAPAPGQGLPALATAAFLAATGQRVGSTIPVTAGGVNLTVRIAGEVSAFPTVSGSALIVNQATLQQALVAAGALPEPVTEWWLRTGNGAAIPRGLAALLPAGSGVTDEAAVRASLLADPLAAAPQLAMLAIAAGAAVLAAAGLAVGVASARERARDISLLRALGATRRQVRGLLCLEQALLAAPGAAAGLILGAVLARFIVPAVTLTSSGAHPQPPVIVQVPLAIPASLAVAVAVVPVLIVALSADRGAALASRLREEAQT